MEDKLRQEQSHKLKPSPKNDDQQPNIIPPDIMNIDTVTQLITTTCILKTVLLATAPKTRSKMVHFNTIVDVKEIE